MAAGSRRASIKTPAAKQLKPFVTEDIKVLLLENVNTAAVEMLTAQGYQVEFIKTSLGEDELIEKIKYVLIMYLQLKILLMFCYLGTSTLLASAQRQS